MDRQTDWRTNGGESNAYCGHLADEDRMNNIPRGQSLSWTWRHIRCRRGRGCWSLSWGRRPSRRPMTAGAGQCWPVEMLAGWAGARRRPHTPPRQRPRSDTSATIDNGDLMQTDATSSLDHPDRAVYGLVNTKSMFALWEIDHTVHKSSCFNFLLLYF